MSKNAAQIRDILRGQFDEESSRASDPSVAALFLELARTLTTFPMYWQMPIRSFLTICIAPKLK